MEHNTQAFNGFKYLNAPKGRGESWLVRPQRQPPGQQEAGLLLNGFRGQTYVMYELVTKVMLGIGSII